MAQSSNKGGVLPTWTVAGATEAINAAVWPPLHQDIAFELLQRLQRHFERVTVQATWLSVVVSSAGWQVAYRIGKPVEQPLSQRTHLHVKREPVESLFREFFHRRQSC